MLKEIWPRHVLACQHSPSRSEKWYIWTWKKDNPAHQTRIPYSCNSWRCPVCRRYEASVTFARIKEATEPLESDGWVYFVLTLDRNGYYGGKKWLDVTEAYGELGRMTRKFLKRLRRRHDRPDVPVEEHLGHRWVAVVEAHKSGFPHMNLMVYCPELAAELRAGREALIRDPLVQEAVNTCRDAWRDGASVPREIKERARGTIVMRGVVARHATESGWGAQSSAEAARDADSVAGYLTKLCGSHDKSISEVAKLTQLPTNAPSRFRRLRCGTGFLPRRKSNPETTGVMLRRRRSDEGDWQILRVQPPKDAKQEGAVQAAIDAENSLILEEEHYLSQQVGRTPQPMPPIRYARRGELEDMLTTSDRNWAMSLRAMQGAADG